MVLSNKKLKKKLREAVTKSLTASEQSNKPADSNLTRESLKALLKSKIKRRDKRKESLISKTIAAKTLLSNKTQSSENDNEGLIEKSEKKKKKKRKREEDVTKNVELEDKSEKEVSVKNKKKKKYKKKKSEKKVEIEKKIQIQKADNEISQEIGTDTVEADYTNDAQDTGEAAMKVYVGGIPYYSTEDDIRSFFESCGTITEIDCMMFPESGKFRGIAIISFKTDAAAKRALVLDGSDMGGLFLKVVPYKPTKAKKYTEDFAPSIVDGYNRIYVGNLSWNITEDELNNFFSGCNISSIRFGEDKETKEFRGFAHVDFADSASLNKALKLDQEILCGRPVRVRCAVPPKKKLIQGNTPRVNETSEVVADIANANVAVVSTVVEEVSGKIRRRTCYECGEKGHLSSSCPKKRAADEANGGET